MDFSSQYGFKHTTSSPYHSQGNGRAEAAVKVSESMLKKSDDFQIALLNYRNTPPKGHTYSPAQRMVSRRTRTTLPTADHLLEPMSINRDTVSAEIKAKRNTSKAHYDKTAGPEQNSINIGEFVYARPPTSKPGNPWAYGRVTGQRHSRSYTIQTPTVPFDEIGYTSGMQHLLLPKHHRAPHPRSRLDQATALQITTIL